MTTPTKPAKSDGRHWAIAILAGLLVALPLNYFSHSGVGYVFGLIAGALAWHIFKPRRAS